MKATICCGEGCESKRLHQFTTQLLGKCVSFSEYVINPAGPNFRQSGVGATGGKLVIVSIVDMAQQEGKFAYTVVYVKDVAQSVEFYKNAFGIHVHVRKFPICVQNLKAFWSFFPPIYLTITLLFRLKLLSFCRDL
jgi:hypothetical protein